MEHEITVGVQSGNVTFSFKTDKEGRNLKEGFEAIDRLISSHKELLQKVAHFRLAPPVAVDRTAISISQLGIPSYEKEVIVNAIDRIPRFDLLLILLYYAKKQLDFEQIMSLSKELGKLIKYNWLDSEPHRPERKGFIMSERIPGKQQKLYSLTERGKKKAESIIDEAKKDTQGSSPLL
jgi:DNA-binding HxlR family transcriptional regulator